MSDHGGLHDALHIQEKRSEAETDALIDGFSDKRLAENYSRAVAHPGTVWHRKLSAEIGRRDALGGKRG